MTRCAKTWTWRSLSVTASSRLSVVSVCLSLFKRKFIDWHTHTHTHMQQITYGLVQFRDKTRKPPVSFSVIKSIVAQVWAGNAMILEYKYQRTDRTGSCIKSHSQTHTAWRIPVRSVIFPANCHQFPPRGSRLKGLDVSGCVDTYVRHEISFLATEFALDKHISYYPPDWLASSC